MVLVDLNTNEIYRKLEAMRDKLIDEILDMFDKMFEGSELYPMNYWYNE